MKGYQPRHADESARKGAAAERLSQMAPEVRRREDGKVRVFLPAARVYGRQQGGAVAVLSAEVAEALARALAEAVAGGPA